MFDLKFHADFISSDWTALQGILIRLHLSIPLPSTFQPPAWRAYPHPFLWAEELGEAEAPWQSAVESTIEELCTSGAARTESPEVAYFVSLRAQTASWFVASLSYSTGESIATIVPFPELPPLQVARWFLIPWWRVHGRAAAGREQLITELGNDFRDNPGNA